MRTAAPSKMLFFLVLILVLSSTEAVDWDVRTPLDEYLARPDPTYTWRELAYYNESSCDMYVLNMTSQTYKDASVSDNPVWSHHLVVSLPKGASFVHKDAAFLFIGGGRQTDEPPNPEGGDLFLAATCEFARDVGLAGAYLKQIPNQPFTFTRDPDQIPKTEDALIAFTWRQFFENTSDPEIILQMPMAKAAIRAMDTVNALARQKVPDSNITKFSVAGGSKRGWVSWLLASTDHRVVAAAPIVLTILNMWQNFNHHYQAYGGWSFALGDYWMENITQYINQPEAALLGAIIDPYEYRERLRMAKVVVCAAGDEFFKPDDSHHFFSALPEPKYMLLMDNTHHGVTLSELRVYEALAAFTKAVLTGYRMPQLAWNIHQRDNIDGTVSGVTRLTTDTTPTSVTAWTATSDDRYPDLRDFRWATLDEGLRPILWDNITVSQVTPDAYEAEVDATDGVWTGLIVNARYRGPPDLSDMQFDFTTEVNIVPDTLPHPPCTGPAECWGELM